MELGQASLFEQTGPGQYYNTNGSSKEEKLEKRKKIIGQTEKILEVFANAPHVTFTPWEVFFKMGERIPITSVRRAITTLEHERYLIKTDQQRPGYYGEKNFTWRLDTSLIKDTAQAG